MLQWRNIVKLNKFNNMVRDVLSEYGLSARAFAVESGINERSVQRAKIGKQESFSPKNERLFYDAVSRLENCTKNQSYKNGIIDLTSHKLPVCIKLGNLFVTAELRWDHE